MKPSAPVRPRTVRLRWATSLSTVSLTLAQTLSTGAAWAAPPGAGEGEPASQPPSTNVADPDSDVPARASGCGSSPAEPERLGRCSKAHTLRTFTSMGLVLGVFSLGYWLSRRDKMAGWSYFDFGARVDEEAWRFDNNSLVVNYLLHPVSGGVSYAAARADHHGIAASAAFSFLSSLLWESVFEYRAKVSLNDLIVTPLAGIPIGEFMHKLGLYLDTASNPRAGMRVAQWTLGPLVQLDRRLDGADHAVPHERDSLGLTRAIWHEFRFETSASAATEAGRLTTSDREYGRAGVSMRGRLVSLPGYLREGRFSRGFYKIDVTSLELGMEGSKHGAGFFAQGDSLLAGHHAQDIRGAGAARRGFAATTGVSLAFSYLDSRASSFREQLGALHMPGPAIDWHLDGGPLRLAVRARAHPDFAGVSGLTYDEWMAAHPGERGKHILRNMGYFYAWGGSGALAAELSLGPLRAKGDVFYGRYRSQEGLNKWQERITHDVPAGTEVLSMRGDLGVEMSELPIALGVNSTVRRWDSWVGEFGGRAQVSTVGFQLSATF